MKEFLALVEAVANDKHIDKGSVEKSLQKALDSTTPDRPGCPWDGEYGDNQTEDKTFIKI